MTALLAILAALDVLVLYCCCVVAGEADRQMEELERGKGEEDDNG